MAQCMNALSGKPSGKSQLRSKQSSKVPSPDNFATISGCFERYTRVTALGRLKKEERKKEERKKMNTEF